MARTAAVRPHAVHPPSTLAAHPPADEFKGARQTEHQKTSPHKRGTASHALWLPTGHDEYETETRAKFPGHAPPPAAPRAVEKWEPNTLPFYGHTETGDAYKAHREVGRPAIHQPRQKTVTL